MNAPSTPAPATLTPAAARLRWAVRLGGTGVCGALVASHIDLHAVEQAWRGASPGVALVSMAAFSAAMGLRVGKWIWQLDRLGIATDSRATARDLALGILLGSVTPARAGELYRIRSLPTDSRPLAVASMVLEKTYEVTILAALVGLGLAAGQPAAAAVVLLPVLGSLVWTVGGLRVPTRVEAWLPARIRTRVIGPALHARDGLGGAGRLGVFALTGLAHALNLVGALGVYRTFGAMSAWTLAVRMPVVTLSNALPISLGGVGVREAAAMAALAGDGLPPSSAALAASVVFLGANVLPAVLLLALLPPNKGPASS